MTIFNVLYLICLGGVIFSFSNIGISYLSNYLHSNLMHDFQFGFKINGGEQTDDDASMQPNFEQISVGGNNKPTPLPNFSNIAENENLSNVIKSMKEHLQNPKELQNIGNALEETVTTILSNDMLRKAFVEDFRGISIDALRDLLKNKKTPSDIVGSSTSDN